MYVLALSDYKQPAAAAGYKPAPQLGRQINIYVFVSQGIEPWLTNADAGTRRPQVRMRPPN